jgi:hypothetical protein
VDHKATRARRGAESTVETYQISAAAPISVTLSVDSRSKVVAHKKATKWYDHEIAGSGLRTLQQLKQKEIWLSPI